VTPSQRGRLIAAKPLSPSATGLPPRAGRDAVAAPHLNAEPFTWRPPVRGRFRANYDASSVIDSWQLARHGADVDWATVDMAEAHQPKGEHEVAPPRQGG
jgi:hypothetical protein